MDARRKQGERLGMIPQQLKDVERWILWKYEDGRKVPYCVRGFRASSMKPSHWTNYEAVRAEYADNPTEYAGLGFVLGDGFSGVDLDGCRDKETGVIDDFARGIIDECQSYWEVSPSGTGVKIFCSGDVPKSYKRMREDAPGKAIEVYGAGRYFAVTDLGEALPLAPVPERLLIVPPTDSGKDPEANGDRPPQWEDARAAVLALPCSVEHNGSHNALLQAVCEVMRWGLTDKHGMQIVKEYNETKCFHDDGETPYPWSKDEILHKWRDAKKKTALEVGKRLHETAASENVDEFGTLVVEGAPAQSGDEFGTIPTDVVAVDNKTKEKKVIKYIDYPLDALEPEAAAYIAASAEYLNSVTASIAVPFMVATGAIIGNNRWADVTGEWPVSPNLWAATISPPGTGKSSLADKAFYFLNEIESQIDADYVERRKDYDMNADKKKEAPPERRRLKVLDTTMEALISVYRNAPNGIVIDADELTGWSNSIGQYKQGGNDKAHWLSLWTGKPIFYDRKTGDPPFIHLKRPIVSIAGGIQPGVLLNTIYLEGREDGMLQRLLVCMPPPPHIARLKRGKIPEEIKEPLRRAYHTLYQLHCELDDNLVTKTEPIYMNLSEDAFKLFDDYFVDLKIESANVDDIFLRGHWHKLDTYTIRFAIILELTKFALGRGSDREISGPTMANAIKIAEWHKRESYRVYKFLATKSVNLKRK